MQFTKAQRRRLGHHRNDTAMDVIRAFTLSPDAAVS
jgi:hypothetical protein